MTEPRLIAEQLKNVLDQSYRTRPRRITGSLGDGTTEERVVVSGAPDRVYFRPEPYPAEIWQVLHVNANVPQIFGFRVICEYDPETADWSVVDVDRNAYVNEVSPLFAVRAHGAQHVLNETNIGSDPVYVYRQMVMSLRPEVPPDSSLRVYIERGALPFPGVTEWPGDYSPDLTSYQPASNEIWLTLYIGVDGTVGVEEGAASFLPTMRAYTAPPEPPVGTIPICYIALSATATTITRSELYDARIFWHATGTMVGHALIADWDTGDDYHIVAGQGIEFDGGEGINALIVPDNLADAFSIEDAGATQVEYMRIVSTDAQQELVLMPEFQETVRLGHLWTSADVGGAEYGSKLYFSGAKSVDGTWNGDNSDPLWIARYNVDNDETEMRVNIGDNNQAGDAFVVGYTAAGTGVWTPIFRVQMDGTITGGGGSGLDHGGLSGLADDDHTQYLLAAGTRALSGAWDVGAHLITFGAGIAFDGASAANIITVPDNFADALNIEDAGGFEFFRVRSTNGGQKTTINPGADTNHKFGIGKEASAGWHYYGGAAIDTVMRLEADAGEATRIDFYEGTTQVGFITYRGDIASPNNYFGWSNLTAGGFRFYTKSGAIRFFSRDSGDTAYLEHLNVAGDVDFALTKIMNGYGEIEGTQTLTGALSDGYAGSLALDPGYSGAYTVTRHNYIDVQNPSTASGAAVTDACVLRFDAAAGTHKAVDAGSTKSTPGGVDAWMKININGTIYYVPAYTSKTA